MNVRSLMFTALPLLLAAGGSAAIAAAPAAAALPQTSSGKQRAPRPAPAGVTIVRDVPYLGAGRAETLDLYLPSVKASRPAPAVVLIHGGGWQSGTKSAQREFEEGTTLAKAGYVAASVEYRLAAQGRWPTNVYDCKNAVRFLRANASKYNVDVSHIAAMGGSAGGHLALMVGYTSDVAALEPKGADTPYPGVSDRVQCVVDMYGITDLPTAKNIAPDGTPTTTRTNGWNAVFGDHQPITAADRELASPVTHIGPKTPPTLILHGTADTTVDRDQSVELDKKLTAAGVPHQFVLVPGVGHTFDMERQVNQKPLPADLRPTVLAFLGKYLKGSAAPAAATLAAPAEPASAETATAVCGRRGPVYILIKADDLRQRNGRVDPRWQPFVDFIKRRRIKASIGIICDSLEGNNPEYVRWIKEQKATGLFEFWDHGYDHKTWKDPATGRQLVEFQGVPFEQQKEHLEHSEQIAKEKLGFALPAFGAPNNSTDYNTVRALQANPDVKIWLYGDPQHPAGKLVLDRVAAVNIENPIFHPSLEKFIQGYNAYPDRSFFLIQGHPWTWDATGWAEFTKIVDWLTSQGAVFTTPSEYAEILRRR